MADKRVNNVYDDVRNTLRAPTQNLNSANIFLCLVCGQTAKFEDCSGYTVFVFNTSVSCISLPVVAVISLYVVLLLSPVAISLDTT